jgi:hypothetical protein
MGHFAVGSMSLVSAIVFPLLYLVGYLLNCGEAWMRRAQPPRDRVIAFLVLAAVVGFVAGIYAQPPWDRGVACNAAGESVLACVFFPFSSSQ